MEQPTATIYARQSLDRDEDEHAVTRQLEACRALCAERGWAVAGEVVDNDRSATSGAARPGFEQLLKAPPQRVVVWHVDRLVRLTRDLERVIDAGLVVHAVKAGHLDLSNPAGRAVARTVTAWATYEGEHKAERQRAANRQRAQRGAAQWTRRPFGFDRDGSRVVVVEDEARVIVEAAGRLLEGETLAGVAADLNRRGVTTSTGGRWSLPTLKRVLLNPRVTGRVVYRGEDMGRLGPVILDDEVHERLAAKLTDPRRRTAPSTRVKYLLSGLARCGRCDRPMFATNTTATRVGKYSVYRCRECKRARRRDLVDEVVVRMVVDRLERPDAVTLLSAHVDVAALADEAVALRERRDALAVMLADGLLGGEAVRTQAGRLSEQIGALERQIEGATQASPLTPLVGAADVRAVWESLDIMEQRAVVDALLVVYVDEAGKGRRFDPEQVRVEWREGNR